MKKLLITALLFPVLLIGEVIEVSLKWDASECEEKCQKQMERELRNLSKVSQVTFNGAIGEATLKWRANEVFRPEVLDRVAQRRALTFSEVGVTLRGTVKKRGQKSYAITSIGDSTQFVLAPKQDTGKDEKKPKPKVISPNFLKRLEELARSEKVIEVKGIVELPYKQPNVLLIPEHALAR